MATIVPVPVSVPLCHVALKFFLREVEPISPSFEFGLTWDLLGQMQQKWHCVSSESGSQETFHASAFLVEPCNRHENKSGLPWALFPSLTIEYKFLRLGDYQLAPL